MPTTSQIDSVLQRNVGFAKSAVEYVASKLKEGRGNHVADMILSGYLVAEGRWGTQYGVSQVRTGVSSLRGFVKMGKTPAERTARRFRAAATLAEVAGYGNCGEQAAVAYFFLLDSGVRPLDYIACSGAIDHAFVVVGRSPGGVLHDPSTWGNSAVVCDPWHKPTWSPLSNLGRYYPAFDFRGNLYEWEKLPQAEVNVYLHAE